MKISNPFYDRDYAKSALPENVVSINDGEDVLVFSKNRNGECSDATHSWCGGYFEFINIKNYNLIICTSCKLKIKYPKEIKTTQELKVFLEKDNIDDKIKSRADILDIREE